LNDVHNALCLENGWSPLWMSSNPNAPVAKGEREFAGSGRRKEH